MLRPISLSGLVADSRYRLPRPSSTSTRKTHLPLSRYILNAALISSTVLATSPTAGPWQENATWSARPLRLFALAPFELSRLDCTIVSDPVAALDDPVGANSQQGGNHRGSFLRQLGFLRNRFPALLRPLRPLGTMARASFARRAKVRLSAAALDRVRVTVLPVNCLTWVRYRRDIPFGSSPGTSNGD